MLSIAKKNLKHNTNMRRSISEEKVATYETTNAEDVENTSPVRQHFKL
jgi:hypothetical protein